MSPHRKRLCPETSSIAVIMDERTSAYWKEDTGAAVENMLLAIVALGYASVWVKMNIGSICELTGNLENHGFSVLLYLYPQIPFLLFLAFQYRAHSPAVCEIRPIHRLCNRFRDDIVLALPTALIQPDPYIRNLMGRK